MANDKVAINQVHELLYQALETELGGEKLYQAAIEAAQNEDFRNELTHYLEDTRRHQQILLEAFGQLGLDPQKQTPGRKVVAHHGASLVEAIRMAREAGDPKAAELVAGECVILAETKDHENWSLIGLVCKQLDGREQQVLQNAHDQVEDDEDHHLYHTTGWTRELWLDRLGLDAQLPPPEEKQKISTKRAAGRIEEQRGRSV